MEQEFLNKFPDWLNETTLNMDFDSLFTEAVDPGEATITALANIVKSKQAAKVPNLGGKGQKVDIMTAGALMSVYNALAPANQAKFKRMLVKDAASFQKLLDFAWKKTSK